MKTAKLLLSLLFIGISILINAQCASNNTFLMNATPPASPGVSTMTVNCMNGGQYVTVNVIAGNTYTFATCGNTAFDTQLTVLNAAGGAFVAYNDDGCGAQSTITWIAGFTGAVNVLLDQWPCMNTGLCTTLTITSTPPVQNGTGCNTNTTICTQGIGGPFGFSTPGPPVSTCLDFFGPSYAYIVLYITQSGPLQMLIDGNAPNGFLDVAVFNVPSGMDPCTASLNDANQISCNYASASSGCNQIGTAFPCASSVPSPNVVAGDVLFIIVENWSGLSTNFTLDLAAPPAAQSGPPDATITPAGPFCNTDGPVQLVSADLGGTWTGPGVSASGLFNPGAVGPGTYNISYSIGSAPCLDTDASTITVTNCACLITTFNSTIGACQPNNTFTVSGNFTFQDNPGSGNLIVSVTNSAGTYTQTFTPPFVDGQVYNFSISGIPSNGSAMTITVYFANDVACTSVINAVSPVSCACNVDIGTFTVSTNGNQAGNNFVLCYGDDLDITSNGNGTNPGLANAPPGPPYTPGISWMIYSCPPTIALTPNPVDLVTDDPCLLGIVSNFNLNETNDMYWINAYPPGTFTNNTVYFVPITMYSLTNIPMIYSYTNTSMPCYEMGNVYSVQYVPQITQVSVQNCAAGTVTTTVSGGQPAINGSVFTGSSLLPATASFSPATASNGGNIVVTGLTNGQAYSFTITDASGCTVNVSGTFVGLQSAAFTYPSSAYCKNGANPTPTITGVPGGTFSSTAGLVINASSGLINLTTSTAGTYTVTYTSPGPTCPGTATFVITINPLPIVDGNDAIICAGASVTLNGTGATTYTWNNGVTNGVAFTPVSTTTYTVTGTITATGCVSTGTAVVTVNPLDNATFTTTNFCQGAASPAATVTGLAGGTFSFNPVPGGGVTINPTTGSITGGVGGSTYTVQYTTNGPCPQTSTQPVTVYALPVVNAADVSVCIGGTVAITATGAVTYNWNNGLGAGQTQNVSPVANTTYTVTGTSANGCVSTDVMTVTVLSSAPINAGADVTICSGVSTTLTASGGVSYTWLAPISAAGASQTVSPVGTTTYTVNGTDASGCTGTDQVMVTVNPIPTVTAVADQVVCATNNTTAVNFTGPVAGTTYSWTNTNATIGLGASGAGNIGAFATINSGSTAQVATITVTPTANGCVGTPDVFTITVNPIPTVTPVADQVLCANTNTTAINFTGAVVPTTYNWTNTNSTIGLGAAGAGNIGAFSALNGGSTAQIATVTVTPTSNGCLGTPDVFTITVNPIPAVTPVADQVLCANMNTTAINFTGTVAGATYNWTNTNATIGLGAAGAGNIGAFSTTNSGSTAQVSTITVIPTVNGCVGTPDVFTITVNPIPTVTAVADQILCANTSTTAINFTGSTAGATYNWTNTNASIGLPATGAGSIGSFTAINAGATSQVATITVTPTANGCVGVADVFTITVNPLPTAVISGTASVCLGGASPTITFTGSNGVAPYTFSYSINGGATQTVTSVGATATVAAPSGTVGTYNYNLLSVQSAAPALCSQSQAGTATITVNPNPTPVINGAAQYCTGTFSTLSTTLPYSSYSWSSGPSTPTVNVTAVNNPITVTVTNAQGCSGTSAVFTVIENNVISYNSTVEICQGGSTTIHGNVQSVAGVYSQTYMLPTGCDSTSNVTLVVHALPTINGGANVTACFGTSVTLNAVGAPTMVWNNGGINGVPFNQAVGTVTYTATGTDAFGCVNTDVVDVTINPPANVDPIANQTLCNGLNSTAVNFTGTVPGTSFNWTNSNASIGLAASGAGNIGSFNLTNSGSTAQVATIVVTPSAAGCVGPTGQFTITVNPTPSVNPVANQTLCNTSATAAVNFTSPVAGASYTWTNSTTSIGLGASGSGNLGSFVAANAGSTAQVATITITPSASGCVGPTGQFTITVNPTPTVNAIANQVLCNNAPTTAVNFASPVAGTTYTWTNTNAAIGLGVSGSGNIASFAATNSTGSPILGTVTITPTANGCVGPTGQFTITVNPTPSVDPVGNQTLCDGTNTAAVNFTGSSASITYNWTNTNTSIGLGAAGSGNIGSFGASNAGTTAQVASITVSPTQNGCIGASQIFTITVNPTPTVNPLIDQTLCASSNTSAINFTGATAGTTYDWTNTNPSIGLSGSGTGNITSFVSTNATSSPINGTITVTPTANGCVGSTQSALITVNPLPTGTISGTTALCIGAANPTITLTGSTGVAPYTFTYNVNNTGNQTITSVGNTATISVPTLVAGVFNFNLVSVQDASVIGCVQTQAGVATVTVNALPIVFAGNDLTICDADQAILTASGANSYQWDQGVVNGVAFNPASSATYTVIGTDANGCVNTDNVMITLESAPIVSFFGDNLAGCAPLTVTFTNTTLGALTDCIWTLENGTTLNGCGSVTTTFNSPGTFDVTLTTTSATGCTASATYTDYIYVEADPIASFIPSSSSVSSLDPTVSFDNTSTGAISYQWDFGDGSQVTNEVSPTNTFPDEEAGNYQVELIAYSPLGCTDTAYATIQLTEELLFYVPNTFTPDDDDYNPTFQPVFSSGYDPYDYTLLIFNRWGEIIFESHNAAIGWDGTYGGELTQDGTYTWKIEFKVTSSDERKVVLGHVSLLR